jgi:hypothetical protein
MLAKSPSLLSVVTAATLLLNGASATLPPIVIKVYLHWTILIALDHPIDTSSGRQDVLQQQWHSILYQRCSLSIRRRRCWFDHQYLQHHRKYLASDMHSTAQHLLTSRRPIMLTLWPILQPVLEIFPTFKNWAQMPSAHTLSIRPKTIPHACRRWMLPAYT